MPNTTQKPIVLPPTEDGAASEGMPSDSFELPGEGASQAAGVPQLTPPEEVESAVGDDGITAWLTNRKIVGLWSNSANKNSWIRIAALGWRRLAGSETAVTCMTMLAAHARAENRNVNVRLETDGMIHEMYVW
ncbi:MAG: hypothetical protein QNJ81_04195 [Acidimicrobiia bacterium]|nr:hypothetical protein [Acidimicrobiia bacterium]